jgi:hypothetical protein
LKNSLNREEALKKAFIVLKAKDAFMQKFMEHYVLNKINVPKHKMLATKRNYDEVIDFCLRTRAQIKNNELEKAKDYFSNNYLKFKNAIKNKDFEGLKKLLYTDITELEKEKKIGVGQKISSLILEVFIHYGIKDGNLRKKLFVPLDRHVVRVLEYAFNVEIKQSTFKYGSKKFHELQNLLKKCSVSGNSIYFDYLWFIGKIFHPELSDSEHNRGYRLCSMCWIKDCCLDENKW